MTTTAQTGHRGEELAAEYLRREGFELCDLNWRCGRYEIDIVARRYDELHFVEVKTRRAGGLTSPEQAVTSSKCRALMHGATAYMAQRGCDLEPRFDLIAIDMRDDGQAEVRFVADAIEYHW
ncbi:MAG: YraN family protein [Alistipes sp.]